MPMREILDMVNEDVTSKALGGVTKKKKTLLEEGRYVDLPEGGRRFVHKTSGGWTPHAPGETLSAGQKPFETTRSLEQARGDRERGLNFQRDQIQKTEAAGAVEQVGGGLAKKALGKVAEAGVTAAVTAVGGPAAGAVAKTAMKGAKALKTANKIAGTVRDVSKALTPSETTKQKLGGAARTAALVKSLVGTRKIDPDKDERLQAMKEQYKQVAATETGLTPAEKRQIRGETAAQTAKGFEQFGDPNRVGATTADLDRLEERELQRKRAADYDGGKALEGYAEHQEKRGKTDEVQQDLDDEAERRLRRERDRELEKGTPRWQQKKTGGMTRKEIIGSLGLGDDIPEYILDMSQEELYKLARDKGLI